MPKPREMPEGTLYAVPLEDMGYCVELIAARGRGPIAQGRFFLRKFLNVPDLSTAVQTVRIYPSVTFRHGLLGVKDGAWISIGRLPGYKRDEWVQLETYNQHMDKVMILDSKSLQAARQREPSQPSDRELPTDGAAGHAYVQRVVSKLLSPEAGVE